MPSNQKPSGIIAAGTLEEKSPSLNFSWEVVQATTMSCWQLSPSLLLAFCLLSLGCKVTEVGALRQPDPPTSASPQADLTAGRKHTQASALRLQVTSATEAGVIQSSS